MSGNSVKLNMEWGTHPSQDNVTDSDLEVAALIGAQLMKNFREKSEDASEVLVTKDCKENVTGHMLFDPNWTHLESAVCKSGCLVETMFDFIPIKEKGEVKGFVFGDIKLGGKPLRDCPNWNWVVLFDYPNLLFLATDGQKLSLMNAEGSYVDFSDMPCALGGSGVKTFPSRFQNGKDLASARGKENEDKNAFVQENKVSVQKEKENEDENAFVREDEVFVQKEAVDLGKPALAHPYVEDLRQVIPFFSRRLDILASADEDLESAKDLLAQCSSLLNGLTADLSSDLDQEAVNKLMEKLTELKNILPDLIKKYQTEVSDTSVGRDKKRIAILLSAIQETTWYALDSGISQRPGREFSQDEKEVSRLGCLGFGKSELALGKLTEALHWVRMQLRRDRESGTNASKERKKLLQAINFFESCLTAVLAKKADSLLPADQTCLKIAMRRIGQAMSIYAQKRHAASIPEENKTQASQYHWDSDKEPFWNADSKIGNYVKRLVEMGEDKISQNDRAWALRYAKNHLGVPVSTKKRERSEEAYIVRTREAEPTTLQKIRLNYCDQFVKLTPAKGGCGVPDDKILSEVAKEAYVSSKWTDAMLSAVDEKKKIAVQRHKAKEYLNYKLPHKKKYSDHGKFIEDTLYGEDIKGLDKPSTAKVILAAKLSEMPIDPSCQEHLEAVLQTDHRRFNHRRR